MNSLFSSLSHAVLAMAFVILLFSAGGYSAEPPKTEEPYEFLVTQDAKEGKPPEGKVFTQWLLDEINHDSLMRSQIAEDVTAIESNGRTTESVVQYYSPDKKYLQRLVFVPANVATKRLGVDKSGLYHYESTLQARDAFRGGFNQISFIFRFKVKVEAFAETKAFMISVVSYPKFLKKEEKEVTN